MGGGGITVRWHGDGGREWMGGGGISAALVLDGGGSGVFQYLFV